MLLLSNGEKYFFEKKQQGRIKGDYESHQECIVVEKIG
jgi:hypothetical protein